MFDEDEIIKMDENEKSNGKGCFLIIALVIGGILFCGAIGYKYILNPIGKALEPSVEMITNSRSPDGKYMIQSYTMNAGATVDWYVQAYLIEEGKDKKEIYTEDHVKEANIKWIDNDTVSINGHVIDLPDGRYDFAEN